MLAIPPQLTDPIDAVRAVGHRGGQIGEHIPGRMRPRPLVRAQVELPFTDIKYPHGVAVDNSGAIYVTDYDNNRVVKLAAG